MKPETMKSATQDRLATGEEVRRATSTTQDTTQDRLLELCQIQGDYCQMDSDLGGIIRYPTEEFEFFAYLSEMDESVAN
jgi:phage pi2 protein 07